MLGKIGGASLATFSTKGRKLRRPDYEFTVVHNVIKGPDVLFESSADASALYQCKRTDRI